MLMINITLGTMNGWTGEYKKFAQGVIDLMRSDPGCKSTSVETARCWHETHLETEYACVWYDCDSSD